MSTWVAVRFHVLQSLRSEGMWTRDARKHKWSMYLYLFGMVTTFVSSYISLSKTGEVTYQRTSEFAQYMGYLFLLLSFINIQGNFHRIFNEEHTDFLRLHGLSLAQISVLRYFEGLIGGAVFSGFLGISVVAFLTAWRGLGLQTLIGVALFIATYALSNAVAMAVVCWLLALGQHKLVRVLSMLLLSGGMLLFFVGVNIGVVSDLQLLPPVAAVPAWGPWLWAARAIASNDPFFSLGIGLGVCLLMAVAALFIVRLAAFGYARYVPSLTPRSRKHGRSVLFKAVCLVPVQIRHLVWKDLLIMTRDRRKLIPLITSVGLGLVALLLPFFGRSINPNIDTQILTVFVFSTSLAFLANAFVGLSALSHDGPLLVWVKQHPAGLHAYVVGKSVALLCTTLPLALLISGTLVMRLHLPVGLVVLVTCLVFVLFAPMTTAIAVLFFNPSQTSRQSAPVAPLSMISLMVAQAMLLYGGLLVYLSTDKLPLSHSILLGAILAAFWVLAAAALTKLGLKRLSEVDLPL